MKNIAVGSMLFVVSCLSCKNREYRTTQARIVERRDVGNGKIRLSYLFKAGQTTIAGVKTVDNAVVVSSDSCSVEYKVSNPLENNLMLP
ncbi:MAG: hypothetical protein QM610_10455 [Chitinophagaceae bacterium]